MLLKYKTQMLFSLFVIMGMLIFITKGFRDTSQKNNNPTTTKKISQKVKVFKTVIPMYSYKSDHSNAKRLNNAIVDPKLVHIFFKPTSIYTRVSLKCCKVIDNEGTLVNESVIEYFNKKLPIRFALDLSAAEGEVRELSVDAKDKHGRYDSYSFVYRVGSKSVLQKLSDEGLSEPKKILSADANSDFLN